MTPKLDWPGIGEDKDNSILTEVYINCTGIFFSQLSGSAGKFLFYFIRMFGSSTNFTQPFNKGEKKNKKTGGLFLLAVQKHFHLSILHKDFWHNSALMFTIHI